MENLNAEIIKDKLKSHIISLKETQGWIKIGSTKDWINVKFIEEILTLINSQEQRIKELTEENERLRAMTHMLDEEYTETAKRFYKKGVTDMKERIEALFPSDKKYTTISIFTLVQSAKELKGETAND